MSLTTSASSPFGTSRPLSCLGGLDPGSYCAADNWDTSPDSGYYTVCCNGDIIDITGFNSWPGYTLLLKNLVCCPNELSEDRGLKNETEGCIKGNGTPLSQLLSTSTEVAQPWTTEIDGSRTTHQPECFWSQSGLPDSSTTASASSTSASRTLSSSSSSTDATSASPSSAPPSSGGATSILSAPSSTSTSAAGLVVPSAHARFLVPAFLLLSAWMHGV